MQADVVIVGAGTAGCILARRLSDDPAVNVVLIEAGPDGRHPWLRIPAGYGRLFQLGRYHWRFSTEMEGELNGRRVAWPRGRVLGGSGAVNGLVFLRGAAADYARWGESCGADWSYASVLPFFKIIETWHGSASPNRGRSGPIQVREAANLSKGATAFIAASEALGFPRMADINGGTIEGVAPAQINVGRGLRSSTASAYLAPVRSRKNLRILTEGTVTSVSLRNGRATGVDVRREDGTVDTIHADRGVILCAGAIGSPHLLMVSGIGPGEALRRLGIAVAVDNAAVGQNLQDHFYLRFAFETAPAGTLNEI
jgi:choline dehydrogenase